MAIYEYIKVDENGLPVQPFENRLFRDGENIPEGYVKSWQYQAHDDAWWEPRFDFQSNQWVESLTQEEIEKRKATQQSAPTIEEQLRITQDALLTLMNLWPPVEGGE